MKFYVRCKSLVNSESFAYWTLQVLHILNDGYTASILLLLPFIANDISLTLTQVGFLGTLVKSASIVLALPAGFIAMKFGGMRTLLFALFIYSAGFLATGFGPTYLWLCISFLIVGIGIGVFHPIAFAIITRSSSKETRGKAMGNFTAIGDLGRIGISAAFTFIIVTIGWRWTAISSAALALLCGCIFSLFFIAKAKNFISQEKHVSNIKLKAIISHPPFLFATTASFFDSLASSSLFIFLPFLLLKRGVNPTLLGTFVAAFFIGNLVGKTALGRFVDKYGNAKVFILSEILMALFILLLANSVSIIVIILCSIILGMFTKGTYPVIQTMVSESAEHHGNFEKSFAVNTFVSSIASTIAPLLLGLLSDKFNIIVAFNMMAIFALLAILPAYAFKRSLRALK